MSDKRVEQKFAELLDVMARLRSETGCPWDKEQTHLSLKPCLLEETYEFLDALDDGDPKKLKRNWAMFCFRWFFTPKSPLRKAASTLKMSLRSSPRNSFAAILMCLPANRCPRILRRS